MMTIKNAAVFFVLYLYISQSNSCPSNEDDSFAQEVYDDLIGDRCNVCVGRPYPKERPEYKYKPYHKDSEYTGDCYSEKPKKDDEHEPKDEDEYEQQNNYKDEPKNKSEEEPEDKDKNEPKYEDEHEPEKDNYEPKNKYEYESKQIDDKELEDKDEYKRNDDEDEEDDDDDDDDDDEGKHCEDCDSE